jgi:Holliday junction resolvasome RuvABC endonuclease subunit
VTLAHLSKPKANSVLGIAFCKIVDGKPTSWGEIEFTGSDVFARLLDAKRKVHALHDIINADVIAMESAIMVRSAGTAIKMAYVFGAILGELLDDSMEVRTAAPSQWQNFIGNKPFSKAQKDQVKKNFPGKSESWYKNKIREMRKQYTMDFAATLGVQTDNNNVGDAVGIAYYTWYSLSTN